MFGLFGRKSAGEAVYDYNPEKEKPIVRASICTGEQVAGFKEKESGIFHEVMLVKTPRDLDIFMQIYGLDHVDKEY